MQGLYGRNDTRSFAIAGISHTIALDAALLQRYPDAKTDQVSPQQPRWRWFARACQLKHGVPCALLIEADSGYLPVVSHLADSAFKRQFAITECDHRNIKFGDHAQQRT